MLAAALLLGARSAAARPPVQLDIDACVAEPRDEIERLCAVELDAQTLPPAAVAPDATRLRVTCRGALSELQVDDPVTGKRSQRLVDLSAVPEGARARLLSLALAELVAASWAELEAPPRRVPPVEALAAPSVRRAAVAALRRRERPGLRLLTYGEVRLPLSRDRAPLAGLGARLLGAHGHHLGWALDVAYARGRAAVPLGEVTTDHLGVGVLGLLHHDLRRAALHLGAGARLGAARVAGAAGEDARAVAASLWGPTLELRAQGGADVRLGRLLLGAAVEAGYAVVPVVGRAAGEAVAGVDGAWAVLQLGVGIAP